MMTNNKNQTTQFGFESGSFGVNRLRDREGMFMKNRFGTETKDQRL